MSLFKKICKFFQSVGKSPSMRPPAPAEFSPYIKPIKKDEIDNKIRIAAVNL